MGLGLPWQSSGFRLCASNAGGREFDPWLENWNSDALWCRQKKKKRQAKTRTLTHGWWDCKME